MRDRSGILTRSDHRDTKAMRRLVWAQGVTVDGTQVCHDAGRSPIRADLDGGGFARPGGRAAVVRRPGAGPDAAENLPDGTDPSDPPGSFHIPYYAIRCTLEDIVASSQGRMSLEVMGQSALGRDMFLVTVNALDTVQQRRTSRPGSRCGRSR